MTDIPEDFKIEHDRLIFELKPIVERLVGILKDLPKNSATETVYFNNCTVTIKQLTKE